jgi:hypothetical protein
LGTPNTLLKIQKFAVSKRFIPLLYIEKNAISSNRRIVTDYKNIRYLCKKYVMKMLFGISEYF